MALTVILEDKWNQIDNTSYHVQGIRWILYQVVCIS